jgi:hypothetical protein
MYVANLKRQHQLTIFSLLQVHIEFMREIYILFVKTFEKYFLLYVTTIPNVCSHEVPRYHDKEVQFVILFNI